MNATKIGLAHRMGWVGYLNSGMLFVKRFDYREGATYPDRGTRYQTFSNEDMLEMETCGELVTLAGTSWLTFSDDGRVVEQHDYWTITPGRASPWPGWGASSGE